MHLPDAIDAARPSVIQLSFMVTRPRGALAEQLGGGAFHNFVLGTGFLVDDDGHVVTAKHVLDAGRKLYEGVDAETKGMQVGVAGPNVENFRANFASCGAEIVTENAAEDLAVIKMVQEPRSMGMEVPTERGTVSAKPAPAVLDPARPRDGESVAISGYPLSSAVLVTSSGSIASSWSFDMHEIRVPNAPPEFTRPELADRFLADVEVNAGNSGGPVYRTEDAAVVGVCVATQNADVMIAGENEAATVLGRRLAYSSGLTVVIPTSQVVRLLDDNGVSYRSA